MSEIPKKGVHWLEPTLPYPLTPSLLNAALRLTASAKRLAEAVSANHSKRWAQLALISDTYHSLLIENKSANVSWLLATCKQTSAPDTPDTGVLNLLAQQDLHRHCRPEKSWPWFFDPKTLSLLHKKLFLKVDLEELHLGGGNFMMPGEMRSSTRRNVKVGQHLAPAWDGMDDMLKRLHHVYGSTSQHEVMLLATMAYHHRLAHVHPFEDGNGRVGRLATHLQLCRLGLNAHLWSLSRGLARRRDGYYAHLHNADQARRGDLDGRGQLSQAALVAFIAFMIEVCQEEIQFVLDLVTTSDETADIDGLLTTHPEIIVACPAPSTHRGFE